MKRYPIERHFKNEQERKKYIIKEEIIADDFYVSLCELYKQSNPKVKIPNIGDKVKMTHIPYWYFKYKGQIWPVYSDDPGQCDDIYINGKWYSGGAYNFYPIPDFCFYIDTYYKCIKKQKDITQR